MNLGGLHGIPGMGDPLATGVTGGISAGTTLAQIGTQAYQAQTASGKPTTGQAGIQIGTGALTGAAAGAAVGTFIFPGIGTAIGAAAGAIAGSVPGIITLVKAKEGGSDHASRMARFSVAMNQAVQHADLQNVPAILQASLAALDAYQALSERASAPSAGPMTSAAIGHASESNSKLALASEALVSDVNTYMAGRDQINPWQVQAPALVALQHLLADEDDVKAALGEAQAANAALSQALAAEGIQ